MGSVSLAKVVTGSNAVGGRGGEKQQGQQSCQPRESFLVPRSGAVINHQMTDGLMKTSLPANGTHTFLPETSTSASMNVPTQYSHLTQDHRSKSWRYEQVMQSMNLTKSPKSQDQATQVDNGTPKAVSSESAATGGHSNTRMFQSPIAVHQTRPLQLPSQLASRRGPLSKTSPYRGVSCYKRTGRWEAHIWHAGRQVHLGTYSTPAEAARVYDMAAISLRGWGADLNFGLHVYKDDPELQDLSCLPGSNAEEIDVVKLVQGLKRRRSSAYQSMNTPMTTKLDPSPEVVVHTSEVEGQRPALEPAGLVDIPLRSISSMYCQNKVDDCTIMDLPETRQQVGSPVEVFVDSSSSQIGHSLWNSGENTTSKPQLVMGSLPAVNCEPVIQTGAGHPQGIPVVWKQDRPSFEKQILLKSTPVAPSRVLSLGRYPSIQSPQLQQGLYHCGEVNRQLLWSTALPASPKVSLMVEKPMVPAEECVLEGKPLPQGHRANSSMIPAFWHRIDGYGTNMTTRDHILHASLSRSSNSGIISKGGLTKVGARPNSAAVAPSNGPLQSLTSVLQGAAQGQTSQINLKASSVGCYNMSGHTPTLNQSGSGSDSQQDNPLASDSQERFANLIKLIHELPAKQLVRPLVESDDKSSANPEYQPHGISTACSDSPSAKMPFEGIQKLRSGVTHRSAFKTWTSSGSDRCKAQNGEDTPSLQDAGSEQSTGVVSDLNNVQTSNRCESCSANDVGENVHKIAIGNHVEETDEIVPASTSCSVPSGSQTSGAGNHEIMEDDLMAAQELCKLSKIVGSGSSNGSTDFSSQSRKRAYTSQVAFPSDDFPTWKTKKQRSMPSRDAKQVMAGNEVHGVADNPTKDDHVLGNSGQANLLVREAEQQSTPDNEDTSYGIPVKIDSGVAVSYACGGKALRKAAQDGDWQFSFGSLIAE